MLTWLKLQWTNFWTWWKGTLFPQPSEPKARTIDLRLTDEQTLKFRKMLIKHGVFPKEEPVTKITVSVDGDVELVKTTEPAAATLAPAEVK